MVTRLNYIFLKEYQAHTETRKPQAFSLNSVNFSGVSAVGKHYFNLAYILNE
jgi:hypothetical protein